MKRLLIIILLSLFFIGCKTKKDFQLQQIKSSYQVKSDSLYIDSITGQITTVRAYIINFDSTGKPTLVNVNETVTEAKKQVKSGKVNKVEKKTESFKNETKQVDKTFGKVDISVIALVLLLIIGLIILYFKK